MTEELAVCCPVGDRRIEIHDQDLMLEPNKAEAIAMALHELATNSVK